MAFSELIDPKLLRRLEHLRVSPNRRLISSTSGENLTRRHGSSLEFSDYRDYHPGDDLRYVDWMVYVRLGRMMVKLFDAEEEINLHLLVDCSSSMSFGEPMSKWDYARRAAAAIGFVALNGNSRVSVSPMVSRTSAAGPTLRGRSAIPAFLHSLSNLPTPVGTMRLSEELARYASAIPPAGVVVVVSDFFDPTAIDAFHSLTSRRHQIILVQVLSRSELAPDLVGDLELIDSETGENINVYLTEDDLKLYFDRLESHQSGLRLFAHRHGLDYIPMATDEPIDRVIESLTQLGVLH